MLITISIGFANRQDTFRLSGLFADGTPGILPSGATFQDVAGTTSAGVGDPVALVLDESGNNNHLVQDINDDKRPTLQEDENGFLYLDFDGIDDFMYVPSLDLTSTDKVTVIAAIHKESDAASGMWMEFSSYEQNGSFYLTAPSDGGSTPYRFSSKGTVSQRASADEGAFPAPITNLITGTGDIGNNLSVLRVDGQEVASNVSDQGAGSYGEYPFYIGSRAGTSLFFRGRIYLPFVLVGDLVTTLPKAEGAITKETGVPS